MRHNRITHLDEIPDGSGRLMVPDNNAVLYTVDKDTGAHVAYLDVRQQFLDNFHNSAGLGTGLGSAEFHPDFAENGLFYTVHTEGGTALTQDTPDYPAYGNTQFHSVVTEWRATDPSAPVFAGTSREVLRVPFAGRVHTVQQIAFNPTVTEGDPDYGNLYVLVGDGGNGVGNGNPQDLATPQGKVFRIDPLGDDSANGRYGIPADNPFVGTPARCRDLCPRPARPAPHQLGPRGRPHDVPRAHRRVAGRVGVRRRAGRQLRLVRARGTVPRGQPADLPPARRRRAARLHLPRRRVRPQPRPGQTGDAGVALNGGFVYRGDIPSCAAATCSPTSCAGGSWAPRRTRWSGTTATRGPRRDRAPARVRRRRGDDVPGARRRPAGRPAVRRGRRRGAVPHLEGEREDLAGDGRAARDGRLPVALPELAPNLVAHYDFDHPVQGAPTWEADQGWSGTDIELVNGGVEMRVADRAYPGAGEALQTQQMSPARRRTTTGRPASTTPTASTRSVRSPGRTRSP